MCVLRTHIPDDLVYVKLFFALTCTPHSNTIRPQDVSYCCVLTLHPLSLPSRSDGAVENQRVQFALTEPEFPQIKKPGSRLELCVPAHLQHSTTSYLLANAKFVHMRVVFRMARLIAVHFQCRLVALQFAQHQLVLLPLWDKNFHAEAAVF